MTQDLFDQARVFFRTVGPQSEADFGNSISVKNCVKCQPKEKTYLCKKCGFKTWRKWRISLHVMCETRYCSAVAHGRAKEFSGSIS